MDRTRIIMNFNAPPMQEDMEAIAAAHAQSLPDELLAACAELTIIIEEFADESVLMECDSGDPYEIIAYFRSGKDVAPGVKRKVATEADTLFLYRRPILDLWCETGEDLDPLMREIMIEEIAQKLDFSEDQVAEMSHRHYQGLL